MNKPMFCSPQPIYLIAEMVAPKGGIPQIGNTIGPELKQVQKTVLQVCAEEDILLNGNPPSPFDLLKEYFLHSQQITRRPTGKKELLLVYSGFTDRLVLFNTPPGLGPEALSRVRSFKPWSPFTYGVDPIPNINLFGSATVAFTSLGGDEAPRASAIYHAATNRLQTLPPSFSKEFFFRQIP